MNPERRRARAVLAAVGAALGPSTPARGAGPELTTDATTAVEATTVDPVIARWAGRFKGSTLILDQSTTPDSLSPAVQQSAIRSYQWWISLRPRYYFTPTLSLRARADLTFEWFNAVDTTHYHEPVWGDVWLDLVYTGIPRFGGIETSVGWRFLLPTSLGSQMRGNVLTLGPTVGLGRDFSTRIGTFGLSLSAAGTYTVTRGLQGTLAGGSVIDCQSTEFSPVVCNQGSPAMNTAFQLVAIASARYAPISRLSISATYVVIDQWAYDVPSATLDDPTGGLTSVSPPGTDQRLRQFGWFLASADVEVQKWLSLSLGYYVYRPVLDPDSHYGNPLWSPGGNTRIFFSIALGLDQLYVALAGRARRARVQPVSTASSAEGVVGRVAF